MNCKWAEDRVVDYLYDELSAEERRVFERHLTECPDHAREVEASLKILSLMRAEDEAARQDAPALAASVFQAAREQTAQPKAAAKVVPAQKTTEVIRPAFWQRWALRPVAMAAVLAVVLVGVALSVGIWPKNEPAMMAEQARPTEVMKAMAPVTNVAEKQAIPAPALASATATDGLKLEGADQAKRLAREAKVESLIASPQTADSEDAGSGRIGASADERRKARPRKLKRGDKASRARGKAAKKKEAEKTSNAPKPSHLEESESSGFAQAPPATEASLDATKSYQDDRDEARVTADAIPQAGASAVVSKPKDSKVDSARAEERPGIADQGPARAVDDVRLSGKRKRRVSKKSEAISADRLYRRARKLFLQNRCKQARPIALAALLANPRHAWAEDTLLDMASCHVKQAEFDKARKIYRRVIKEYPARADEARRALKRLGP